MATFFVYKIRTQCTECGEPIMLDGPTLEVTCRACQSVVSIEAKNWQAMLGFRKHAGDGVLKNGAMIGDQSFYVRYGPLYPSCSSCDIPLDLDQSPPGTDGELA